MKIAIIGGGWYGAHMARVLHQQGHQAIIFEKNERIFSGLSGQFGVRLHAGPHYPRSKETRKNCQKGFIKFQQTYPDLVIKNAHSIYALGKKDADGESAKIDQAVFQSVCDEFNNRGFLDPEEAGYADVISAADIDEPSIVGGDQLRQTFVDYFRANNVTVLTSVQVNGLMKEGDKIRVVCERAGEDFPDTDFFGCFDYVVNTTSFQSLLPEEKMKLPCGMEPVYQPCLALIYEDTKPSSSGSSSSPFSFIVMDGWYPCIMPFEGRTFKEKKEKEDEVEKSERGKESTKTSSVLEDGKRRYLLTHGKYTIMGSYKTPEEAQALITGLDNDFVETNIKPPCEVEAARFWPEFSERFQYCGWVGGTLAKLKTTKEYRSAVTFKEKASNVIYVFPGKVSDIFNVEEEVLAIIRAEKTLIDDGDFQYVEGSVLYQSQLEVKEKPAPDDRRNTCQLQTYEELCSSLVKEREGEEGHEEEGDKGSEAPKREGSPFWGKGQVDRSASTDQASGNEVDKASSVRVDF